MKSLRYGKNDSRISLNTRIESAETSARKHLAVLMLTMAGYASGTAFAQVFEQDFHDRSEALVNIEEMGSDSSTATRNGGAPVINFPAAKANPPSSRSLATGETSFAATAIAWGAVKQGVYTPLYPTAVVTRAGESPMASYEIGMDIDSGNMVTDGKVSEADFVLTSRGAYVIAEGVYDLGMEELTASTTAPQSYSSRLTYQVGNTYLIVCSNGKRAKIRIDQVTSSTVYFSYVLESASTLPSPSGILTLSTTALDFGVVAAGTSNTLSVTLQNTGTASISLTTVKVSGTGFSGSTNCTQDGTGSLAPGKGCEVTVTYSPVGATAKASGTVTFLADGKTKSVTLTGTASSSSASLAIPAARATGPITAQNISVGITPRSSDLGKQGSIFIMAHVPVGTGTSIFFMDSRKNWSLPSKCSSAPTYFTGVLAPITEITLLNSAADLTSLAGTKIYVGYGLGGALSLAGSACNDMFTKLTLEKSYEIGSSSGSGVGTAIDDRLIGTWAMKIPGASYVDSYGYLVVGSGSTAGTLTISTDGAWNWVKSWGSYSGKLSEYTPKRWADSKTTYWGTLVDGLGNASYYIYFDPSDNTLVVKGVTGDDYQMSGTKQR